MEQKTYKRCVELVKTQAHAAKKTLMHATTKMSHAIPRFVVHECNLIIRFECNMSFMLLMEAIEIGRAKLGEHSYSLAGAFLKTLP